MVKSARDSDICFLLSSSVFVELNDTNIENTNSLFLPSFLLLFITDVSSPPTVLFYFPVTVRQFSFSVSRTEQSHHVFNGSVDPGRMKGWGVGVGVGGEGQESQMNNRSRERRKNERWSENQKMRGRAVCMEEMKKGNEAESRAGWRAKQRTAPRRSQHPSADVMGNMTSYEVEGGRRGHKGKWPICL